LIDRCLTAILAIFQLHVHRCAKQEN